MLYTGVTNDLPRRVSEYKAGNGSSFTLKYRITKLVYCGEFTRRNDAITREKQIKAGSRAKKVALIASVNPEWNDLS